MDSEEKETLEKILELAQENNKILRKMRRSILWGRIFHTLYWVIIIGLSVGAYYYIQPYFEGLLKSFGATGSNLEMFAEFPELLKNLQK